MKKRIWIAGIVGAIICSGTAGTVYAKSAEDMHIVNEGTYTFIEDTSGEMAVQPMMMCVDCSSIMQMGRICLPDSRKYSGTRTHSYGLPWSQKTCTVTSYDAWGGYYCGSCGKFLPFEDEEQSDGLARHHCLEIHSSCGAGDDGYYLVCPFGG